MSKKFNPYEEKIIYHTIGNGKTLKVGIISDSQIIPSEKEQDKFLKIFSDHLKNTLEILKSKKIQVLIFAGDLTDSGTEFAYKELNDIFKNVYKTDEEKPIFNFIMGNHDYWLSYMENKKFSPKSGDIQQMQILFYNNLQEKPFSHKVINGYHFINWGCENGSMDDPNQNLEWAETQIKLALEDSEKKPIFITTHFNAKDTVYGAEYFFAKSLRELFNKYQNIIHFSGHSHYSLIDERSIWQKEFTSIQTQSISYTELDPGFENGIYPCDEYGNIQIAGKNYMGLIMDVNEDNCQIQRISFEEGKFYGVPWIIDIPINKNNFRYTNEKRFKERKAPFFIFKKEDDKKIIFEKDEKIQNGLIIKFISAFHDNFVHKYKIELENIKTKEIRNIFYASDFYLLPEDRKNFLRFNFKTNDLEKGEYKLKIYAIESFGKVSENFLEGNITI